MHHLPISVTSRCIYHLSTYLFIYKLIIDLSYLYICHLSSIQLQIDHLSAIYIYVFIAYLFIYVSIIYL